MTLLIDTSIFEYHEEAFELIELKEKTIESKRFEACTFKKCQFTEAEFRQCEFVDCEFIHCNLSMAKFINTGFNEAVFENCKLIGIDWTKVKWPFVKLACPVKFYQCDLSFSNFFEINLVDAVFEECKVHEVDFRGAELNGASLCYNDFYKSIFQHCNLSKSDFTGSTNYLINPEENKITKAKFSFPEVMDLLRHLDITISGLNDS